MTIILERVWNLNNRKARNAPPDGVSQGYFMAIQGLNDLPIGKKSFHEVAYLLKHGVLYYGDVNDTSPNKWNLLIHEETLAQFQKDYQDVKDWSLSPVQVYFYPYPVELYWVPQSAKGHRHVCKAHWRALARKPC